MFKNILIGIFAAILVVAIGTAAYNVIGAQAAGAVAAPVAGNGNGKGLAGERGTGGNGQGGAEDHVLITVVKHPQGLQAAALEVLDELSVV